MLTDLEYDIKWLENVITRKISTKANIVDYKAEIVGAKDGYVSRIVKVSLTWSSNEEARLPKSVVLKIPSKSRLEDIGKDFEEKLGDDWIGNVHNIECGMYALWQENKCPFRIPECFFIQKADASCNQPILVLEDLSNKGSLPIYLEGLNMAKTLNITTELAHMHAWSSMNMDKWYGKFPPPSHEEVAQWGPFLRQTSINFKATWPEQFEIITDELLDVIGTIDTQFYMWTAHEALKMAPVLCHGDMWSGNVFLSDTTHSDTTTKPTDDICAMFDFGMCHAGGPAEDVSRLIYSSLSPQLQGRWKDVLTHYYNTFHNFIGNHKEMPFTFERLLESYQYTKKASCWMGIAVTTFKSLQLHADGKPDAEVQPLLDRAHVVMEEMQRIIQAEKKQ